MMLYRNISLKELYVLFTEGVVVGQFDTEHKDNGYRKEYGKVVCFFTQPYYRHDALGYINYEFVIEVEIPDDEIIAKGVATYHRYYNDYESFPEYADEVYVRQYRLTQVKGIFFNEDCRKKLEDLRSYKFCWKEYEEHIFYGYTEDDVFDKEDFKFNKEYHGYMDFFLKNREKIQIQCLPNYFKYL